MIDIEADLADVFYAPGDFAHEFVRQRPGVAEKTVSGIPATRLEDVTATLTPVWVAWAGAALYGIGTFLYFCTPVRLWLPSLFVMMVSFGISVLAVPSLGVALSAGIATAVGLITSWAINARLGGAHPG